MYDLCDDKLKSNFELMKFFILKFKDDKAFIKKVAYDFSVLSDNEDDNFEIDIIVSEIVGKDYSGLFENIHYISAKCKYNELRTAYFLDSINDSQDVRDYYQMGFDYFADIYAGRETIINYIAKSMVDEIFEEEEHSLEELTHIKFKTKEQLEKFGTTNFILSYISLYDSHLSDYLKTNIKIVEELKNDMQKINDNFDIYNENMRCEIMYWIIEYLINYSLDTGYLSGTQLIKYIAKDLNISHPILEREYEDYDDNDFDEYVYSMAQSDVKYMKLKNRVKEVLYKNEVPDDYFEEKKYIDKCKVLKFKRKDKNNDII